ncbi:cell division protein FtsA [Pediococcus claussenii]|uniref:Cell division protein FtsA n=1 Tax=Pediococcus claussenii (strain ATCC BAA-344 / DSM 14800 / JCM 18046 / KCTC 3811 / LMG 21948 / P06) TaxID=701521 RepID=G8PCU6_PEDCP|nr:cell division protein FtsA [Pediococcus claussenii]AEV95081.1 cell division protein FtsA [Pediococcus claussenii ATCC BAA-344]ANZ70269.1 cell division protein FtsA [Pediococcus claussenii]ANZ72085.1 cell division protein FtsA [Pediococcus claussenii]KRN18942.1 ftsA protein [Pediococcus claussenii]
MGNSGIYVGLDIGTTSIKVIVAEYVKGQMNVIGVGSERSDGMNRGVIVDIDKAAFAIRKAVESAERKANIQIQEVVAGIPANLLKIESCRGMIAISDSSREINNQDVINVSNAASLHNLPPEQEVVDVLPDEFIVDGFDGIKDPRGMVGVRLEMTGSLLTGPKTIIHNLKRAINQAGLDVIDVVVNPLALGKTILNDGEQDFGTIVMDLGAGQTTAAVIHDHYLKYTCVEQEGGQYITKDISVVLNTSLENAEKIKREYGYAMSSEASQDSFPVNVVGQNDPVAVSEEYLSEIIEARLEQTLDNVKERLASVGALEMPGGIVITGGGAALPGIVELVADVFGLNTKIYSPDQMGLRHPAFAQALSLLEYETNLSEVDILVKSAMVSTARVVPEQESNYSDEQHEGSSNAVGTTGRISQLFSRDRSSNDEKGTTAKPQETSETPKPKNSDRVDGFRKWFNDFFD